MAARLQEFAASSVPERNPFLNSRRVEGLRAAVQAAADFASRAQLQTQLAYEQLLAGDSSGSVETLLAVRQVIEQPNVRPSQHTRRLVRDLLGMAYFRLGEQENCVARHSQDSCLVPITGSGVHALPRGSRMAIQEWTGNLQEDPADLHTRWLINLAHMTLGEYPDKLPPEYLIPTTVFESQQPFPRFYDVAAACGVTAVGLSGGGIVEDFDGDGDLDIMSSSWGLLDPLYYFVNNGDGTFGERSAEAGLHGEVGGLNICQTDYNNDGHADVFVMRGAWLRDQGRLPNSLLRNNGDGTFEDVTEEAGLLSFHPTPTAAWGDYDNDGWLDVFVGNESTSAEEHPCELFHNNGDGTFREVAAAAGVARVGMVKGASWGDYDNDGRLDLYLSLLGKPNVLYHNDGPAAPRPVSGGAAVQCCFSDVTSQAGVAEPLRSFATWFWDYDNDGWLDIFAAPFSVLQQGDALADVVADMLGLPSTGERPRLYRNKHDGTFEDVTAAAGLDKVLVVMGANFGDLDNDGFLDCYFGTGDPLLSTLVPNRMFRNDGGVRFLDVTTAGGFGHLQKGHGIAFGDIDNDGDQDIYADLGGAYAGDIFANALFENPGFGAHWITLRLEGVSSNRAAIGVRIKITVEAAGSAVGSDRDIYATVSSGGSFGSSSLQQEIGLGPAGRIKRMEIRWPATGQTQVFTDIGVDQVVKIREGDSQVEPVTLKRFDLSPDGAPAPQCPHHPS